MTKHIRSRTAEYRLVPLAFVPILAVLNRLNLSQLRLAAAVLRELERGYRPLDIDAAIRAGIDRAVAEAAARIPRGRRAD